MLTKRWPCIVVTVLCCLPFILPTASANAGGWYLMTPPNILEPHSRSGLICHECKLRLDAPIRDWTTERSYERVRECEEDKASSVQIWTSQAKERRENLSKLYRDTARLDDIRKHDPTFLDFLEDSARSEEREATKSRYALCIATDDPRLK